MADDDVRYWLGLARIDGLGVRGVHGLVAKLGSPRRIYAASLTELESSGLSIRIAHDICAQKGLEEAKTELESTEKLGARVIGPSSAEYPALLSEIADPPLALYVKGDINVLSRPAVAVVGSRRPTAYGSSVAHRLAADLAARQVVIVSGLARGIDSAAHRGAIEAHGATVAVLGSGIDVIYPRENRNLADQCVASGALISEFPLGTSPAPENFPIRNRVISGLSLGTLIAEAAEYSGSLITARLALEQNREVFAIPGNITSAQSFGPNLLIKQGAKLVDDWMDVFEELPAAARIQLQTYAASSEGSTAQARDGHPPPALAGDQKLVYDALRADEALFVDAICENISIPQPRVLTALLGLEMGGFVRQLPGMNFVRKL